MIKNVFKTALRHIRKHAGYSLLNIIGLTLGITSALFLSIYVSDEISYDRYHENADRIYRVSSKITETDDQFTWIVAQIPMGPQVVSDYPEVESFVRFINMPQALYSFEDKQYVEEDFFYADSTLFDVFSFKVISGDVRSAVRDPGKIVMTETAAARYFGSEDPVGKVIRTGSTTFEVTGVIGDIPTNSHFRFDAVSARNNLPKQLGTWGNFGVFTYLLMPEGLDVKAFEKKMQGMYDAHMKTIFEPLKINIEYILEPIKEIHLHSTNAAEPEPTGSITYVIIFGIVALFLILIAAMNYMNLATARSASRAREVGLRKVVGSGRGMLIGQFLSESIVLTLISLIISIILFMALLPSFNILAGKSFSLSVLYSPEAIISVFMLLLVAGIIGGSYPAFFLSAFSPVTVLKGEITQGSGGSMFRKILVVIQFTISVIMIICTLVVFRQINHLKTMDQGFDQENVISLQLRNQEMVRKYPVLKALLLENTDIKYVTSTNTPIGEGSGKVIFSMETDQGMVQRGINFAVVDHDFVETMGIEITEGRDFSRDMPSDTLYSVVVNQTLANRMGWEEPINKKVVLGEGQQINARVIGVMKDYHQTGMYNEIESLMLVYRETTNTIYIKLSGQNNEQIINYIGDKWRETFPDQPYSYTWLSERFNNQFEADEKRGLIFTIFTMLAIAIACLGLFGLASYMVEQRTKEIGIRKVFGADEGVVIRLILKDFLLLVLISIALATPAAWYLMTRWLENYVYRSGISVFLVIFAAFITLALTIITVSYKAYQAAILNPVQSVRTE
ncbi:MAG TPA: ABC transporter permease [Bacteroidales bacterium]|nr:ABC transporter permease [Bacteroidales bacterium]HPJ59005.1 ABC transporter permease [Bacteroidales bacterium]HPR11154.1 ABC transporter permease [Bacteroidales bacterium]HRW86060.1 ABC transporter permease [Bacteroidales bacterium]